MNCKRVVTFGAAMLLGVVAAPPVLAGTWLIRPDGTGDAATIQAGISSAAPGDTVLLASGTFTGVGNRDVEFYGKGVTVRSESGDPGTCIIDCQGVGRGFAFLAGEGPNSVLDGLTITHGASDPGGAVRIWSDASPTIRNCVFADNSSSMIGGAICIVIRAAPRLEDCTFTGNSSTFGGAVICWVDAEPVITGCTFIENEAAFGGAIECADRAIATVESCVFIRNSALRGGAVMSEESGEVTLQQSTFFANEAEESGAGICCEVDGHAYVENVIIASSSLGEAVFCTSSSSATLTCCDVFGNAGGDWVGYIENQYGQNGNISADPLFCSPGIDDLTLQESSPCGPAHNPECGMIGALPVGCYDSTAADGGIIGTVPRCLHPSAPNPFNSLTTISFSLPRDTWAEIGIYEWGGRRVTVLGSRTFTTGFHSVTWNGRDTQGRAMPTGSYIVRLETESGAEASKISLIR